MVTRLEMKKESRSATTKGGAQWGRNMRWKVVNKTEQASKPLDNMHKYKFPFREHTILKSQFLLSFSKRNIIAIFVFFTLHRELERTQTFLRLTLHTVNISYVLEAPRRTKVLPAQTSLPEQIILPKVGTHFS